MLNEFPLREGDLMLDDESYLQKFHLQPFSRLREQKIHPL
jgi:hypothetical protein